MVLCLMTCLGWIFWCLLIVTNNVNYGFINDSITKSQPYVASVIVDSYGERC